MTLQATRSNIDKINAIGLEVEDVDEETYDLFSHDLPQSNLGMIDDKTSFLQIEVAGDQYEIRQSPGLLTSSNAEGTTGAALWKISPLVAEWLVDQENPLWSSGILHADAAIVELGCGITGLIGLVIAKRVSSYLLTDQRSVLKLLQENIKANTALSGNRKLKGRISKKKDVSSLPPATNVHALELNWENDDIAELNMALGAEQLIDLVVVCDCVFNEFLLEPLVNTCVKLCARSAENKTVLLIAQQLRSDQVFSAFMEILNLKFRVWRVADSGLPISLRGGSGFVVHLAILR